MQVVLGRADGGGSGVGYGSVGGLGVTPPVERLLGAGLHNIDRVDSEELAAPSVDQHNPLNEVHVIAISQRLCVSHKRSSFLYRYYRRYNS